MRVVAIEEHFRSAAARTVPPSGGFSASAASPAGPMAARLAKLDDLGVGRLADMDAAGIDLQVISHNVGTLESLDSPQAVSFARQSNDELAEAVAAHPDRFAGFASLPTIDPRAAAQELERAVGELGFKGALVNGHIRGRFLDHPDFWPIFEAAEGLSVPIYLHPTEPPAPCELPTTRACHRRRHRCWRPRDGAGTSKPGCIRCA